MSQASAGQTVRIHYTAKLENGTLLDTSVERDPMEFELGSGRIITGLDKLMKRLDHTMSNSSYRSQTASFRIICSPPSVCSSKVALRMGKSQN